MRQSCRTSQVTIKKAKTFYSEEDGRLLVEFDWQADLTDFIMCSRFLLLISLTIVINKLIVNLEQRKLQYKVRVLCSKEVWPEEDSW